MAALLDGGAYRRLRIWARAMLGGEPPAVLARELGYADGSGVHRVAQRLQAAAKADPALRRRLERLRDHMPDVKS